jgi:hypothetical protein
MPMTSKRQASDRLTQMWTLPSAATLGSSVRAKGILQELRARLPLDARRSLKLTSGSIDLEMPMDAGDAFGAATRIVAEALQSIERRPIIPREIQDILAISTTERHRWLKDGRLPSAGTRTVKLRGRAKKITFHVFDPRLVEELLDKDLVEQWREEDAVTAAENRRRAAWKAKLTRSLKSAAKGVLTSDGAEDKESRPKLLGWEEFERDGPLR